MPLGSVAIFLFLSAVMAAIVVVARYVTTRRKRPEEALIVQARLSDAILREAPLRDVAVTPRARVAVAVWRGTPVTIEVAGEVPTPRPRARSSSRGMPASQCPDETLRNGGG